MKHKKPGPCEHFDIVDNYYKDTCPDMVALFKGDRPTNQCDYFENNCSAEDVATDDMQRCCRERREVPEDTQTLDMFGMEDAD